MQRLEVSGAVRPIYGSLGVKLLTNNPRIQCMITNDLTAILDKYFEEDSFR